MFKLAPTAVNSTILLSIVLFVVTLSIHSYIGFTRLTFMQDSARDVLIAQEHIANNTWVVTYGPKASVGNFYLPPLYYQLHVILSALFPNQPLVMMLLVLVIESLTPVLLYFLLKDLIDARAALVIAACYSLFYLVLTFSTQAWNPNMIPFFTVLTVLAWYRASVSKRKIWLMVGTAAPTLAASLHFQAVVLAPFVVLSMLYIWFQKKQWRVYLLGAILIPFVIISPYLIGEATQNWENTREIVKFFTTEHSRYYDRVSKPAYVLTYLPSFIERVSVGSEFRWHWLGRSVFWIGTVALAWTARKSRVARWLLLYVITVVVALRLFKGDKLDYYLLVLFPAIPLLMAGLLSIVKTKYQVLLALLFVILIYITGTNVSKVTPRNSLSDLQSAIEFIESHKNEGTIRLVFHNLNYANFIYFGLQKYSNLGHDVSSAIIVDVCGIGDQWCRWKTELQSSESRPITTEMFRYLEKIHDTGEYEFIEQREFGNMYTLVIGKVSTPSGALAHPLIENEDRTGTDYLITTY